MPKTTYPFASLPGHLQYQVRFCYRCGKTRRHKDGELYVSLCVRHAWASRTSSRLVVVPWTPDESRLRE